MSDFSDLTADLFPANSAAAAGAATADADPAKAAEAYKIAPQVGVPPQAVGWDLDGFKTSVQQNENQGLVAKNPSLARFVSDPDRAAAVKDDYAGLHALSVSIDPDLAPDLTPFPGQGPSVDEPGPFVKGVATGYRMQDYGRLARRQFLGDNSVATEDTLKAYEAGMAGDDKYTGFAGFINSVGVLAGQLGSAAVAAQPAATAGAVTGAASTAIGGPAGVVGAGAGYAAGLSAGIVGDFFVTSAGQQYRQLGQIRGPNGEEIPEDVKKIAALTTGAAVAGLAAVTGPLTKMVATETILPAMSKALAQPGVIRAIARAGVGTGEAALMGGALNTAIAFSQAASTELAKTFSGRDFNTFFNDPKMREAFGDQMAHAFTEGALLFGTLHSIPIGVNFLRDRAAVSQSAIEARKIDATLSAAQATKTWQRNPQALTEYIDEQDYPPAPIKISAQKVAEAREKDPQAFSYVTDLDEQLHRSLPTGGDITISAGQYFSRTTPDLHELVKDDIRGESGLTPNEAKDLAENLDQYIPAYHGSPHSFEAFDLGKIGTGEGAQAYGHGLYFAERRGIAEDYRDRLSQVNIDAGFRFEGKEYIGDELEDFAPEMQTAVSTMQSVKFDEKAARKRLVRELDQPNSWNKQMSDEDIAQRKRQFGEDASAEAVAEERKRLQEEEESDKVHAQKTLEWFDKNKDKIEAPEKTEGKLYGVRINRPQEHFLDWDVPFSEQSNYVKSVLEKMGIKNEPTQYAKELHAKFGDPGTEPFPADLTGREIYESNNPQAASKKLSEAGIAGIKYADAASRRPVDNTAHIQKWTETLAESEKHLKDLKDEKAAGGDVDHLVNMVEGDIETAKKEIADANKPVTRNYVVFSDKDVQITHINDIERQIDAAIEMQRRAMHLDTPFAEGAPEGEYDATKPQQFLGPIILPEAAGLSKPDFARYSRHLQDLQADLQRRALDVAIAEVKRKETPLWKDELRKEVENARAELEKRPDIRAYTSLLAETKDSVWKLDRNETDGYYNSQSADDAEAFQRDGTRFSEQLPDKMFGPDGVHPDLAADFFKFGSGKEMLDALAAYEEARRETGLTSAKYFESLVKEEGERRMQEKNGELSERIMREAVEAALSIKQIDVLVDELKLIRPEETLTREAIVAAREKAMGEARADSIRSKSNERLVAKYGLEAERALLKKDYLAAFEAKQNQLLNLIDMKLARGFEAEAERLGKVIDRFSKEIKVEGVNQRFTDRIHQIIGALDVNIPRSVENLTEAIGNEDLRQFIANVKGDTGYEIVDSEFLHRFGGPPALDGMNVNEIRSLHKTIQSLLEVGRGIDTIMTRDGIERYEDAARKFYEQLDEQARKKDITYRDDTPWSRIRSVGREVDSSVIKMEQLSQWIDKNDPFGAFNTYIFRPLKEAQHARDDYLKQLAAWWDEIPTDKAWRKSLKDRIDNKVLLDDEMRPEKLTRKNLLAIALNWGNESNRRVLSDGRQWHPEDIETVLRDNMTEKDWKVVQKIWDITDRMWPDVKKMTKEVTGVAPERIRATPVQTPFGEFKGGYFPLMRDPRSIDLKGGDLYNRPYLDTVTNSAATHDRTGATYPVDLDLDRLPYVLRETVHDIHFRKPVQDVAKFIGDKTITSLIDKAYGPEYTDQLKPWLSYIANDGGLPDPNATRWIDRGSRFLRANMVTQLVGFRPSTALIHGGSALANSVAEVGLRPMLLQVNDLLHRNPETMERRYREVIAESGELRNRVHNLDRDLGAQVLNKLGSSWDRQAYQIFATKLIANLDLASAVVVYSAKKAEGLKAGLSEADAIYQADQSVRIAHGSSGLTDLPSIARKNEAAKWFTSFYGYFNHNYNRLRDLGKMVVQKDKTAADYWNIVSRSVGYLIAPAVIHQFLRHDMKDDESSFTWGAKALLNQIGGGMPIERDIMRALTEGKKPDAVTSLSEVLGGMVQSGVDLYKFTDTGEAPPNWVAHALQTPGWWIGHLPGVSGMANFSKFPVGKLVTGLTTKTGSGWGQYIWDRALDVPEDSDADYMRLLLDGTSKPRKH